MRKVNVVILVLLGVAFLIIIQRNLLNLSDFLHKEITHAGAILPFEAELSSDLRVDVERTGDEIPVVISAADERLGAVVAAMNSIYQNTKANVVFTIVTLNDTVDHLKVWLSVPRLKNIKYKIVLFKPELLIGKTPKNSQLVDTTKPLTFARYYLPSYLPEAEKAIYLDDDVIVQGDIKDLYETNLKSGHAAAFSDDCDSASTKGIVRGAGNQNNYIGFLDFKKDAIKQLGMRANTCSFNPGVIVANLTEWKNLNITGQLEHWMALNTQDDLYSKTLAESITTPPLLIVFYKRHSAVDPMWHIRHLGTTGAGNRYSPQFVKAAKLLHWNGHYKPWGRGSSFTDVWDKWFIPDPTGKFHPIRRYGGEK
ncbi:glycosyltransferase 8 domain-containing protein 1 [Dunckerocampus dactyliophorus]|uniref:glycosyltransferase 8 domain-containing protein 1 n=1 Tax=Dunckerocampus dactyliophorus TaxID=161453 RepID=UPI0024069899|nr:glycosyltransferase 8 domain-containing protein 1 [Dunckerocampus dactyliophorus]XP_054641348.1 glycosyltransferase 8 domain-containing protein 1 [Dunckerocampus dactyliophorus]XP_054641349.1 glycosyltransferase 8 domain-containing protein 1 [Dunckerocampus dactyliophorus]